MVISPTLVALPDPVTLTLPVLSWSRFIRGVFSYCIRALVLVHLLPKGERRHRNLNEKECRLECHLRNLRRQLRHLDFLWLSAVPSVATSVYDSDPVEAYLAAGGNPGRAIWTKDLEDIMWKGLTIGWDGRKRRSATLWNGPGSTEFCWLSKSSEFSGIFLHADGK